MFGWVGRVEMNRAALSPVRIGSPRNLRRAPDLDYPGAWMRIVLFSMGEATDGAGDLATSEGKWLPTPPKQGRRTRPLPTLRVVAR